MNSAERIRRTAAITKHWCIKLRWIPFYLRFRCRGHGHAWHIFTHLTPEERLLLYRLGLQQIPCSVMLEVGSYLGASACFLAAAASEIGGEAKVHCIDTWQNQGMSEKLRDTWNAFQENTQLYSSVIITHRGLSVEVAKTFKEKIDLLFVDGDHSYERCRADVLAWLPHLKTGGILVMHDYGWAEGVQRVIREIIQPQQSWKGYAFQNIYWTRL